MGCNCGSNNNSTQQYVYTDPKGVQRTYRTEIEARAAQIRAGGGGNIRSVAKK
jgi:hypothetical protein